jgi:hypothetical protein
MLASMRETTPRHAALPPASLRRRLAAVALLMLPAVLLGLLARPSAPPGDCPQPELAPLQAALTSADGRFVARQDGPWTVHVSEPGAPGIAQVGVQDVRCAAHMAGPPRMGPLDLSLEAHHNLPLTAHVIRQLDAQVAVWPPTEDRPGRVDLHGWRLIADIVGMAILALGLWCVRRPVLPLEWRLRANHFVPSGIQLLVLAVWGLVCVHLPAQLPSLAAQLLFAVALDIALGLAVHGRWRAGVAPLPVVLSLHFFLWLIEPWRAICVIGVAIASKHLLLREGRPVFNPSALGISLYGLGYLLFTEHFPVVGLVHHMEAVPFLTLLILGLAALPLLRFPIAAVSMGAVVTHQLLQLAWPAPGLGLPTTVLAMALLVTEPRSLPRSGLGRLLVGVGYAGLLVLFSQLMHARGLGDDLSKVMPIPVLNLLAPALDRLAARLSRARLGAAVAGFAHADHRGLHYAIFVCFIAGWIVASDGAQALSAAAWSERLTGGSWEGGLLDCGGSLVGCWLAIVGL